MHTVIETPNYLRDAETAGLSEEEQENVVTMIATNPKCGDMIPGTGGCRKIRVRGRGKGKSGGYRIITYFGGNDVPIFLLTVFGKGERSDLTQKERNNLHKLTQILVDNLRSKARKLRRQR